MAAFNLTAELNLRGPSNLNQVVSNIRRQLSTVSLDLRIDPRASSNIQGITSSVNTLSTALRDAQSSATSLNAALSNLGSTLNGAAGNINNLNNNLNNANNNINNVRNRTREATGEVESFGRQAGLAVRRFAAFSLVAGTMYSLSRAISSAYAEFVNFNKEFIRLQQVTDQTASGLKGLSQEITNLSQNFGVSSQSLLQVSVTLAQAGLSANDTAKALEALAKSALAPSFDNLNDTVEGSIALMRQFGIGAGDLESALGSINAVAAKFAVEAGDIIAAIQRTGGVFAAASRGVSEGKDALNEFISVFTSVRATTRESAETIATGLRTIFTRIQRGSTIQALKEYGVQLTDVEGKFVGAYEAVRRLSDGLSGLDSRDIRFSKIVEELGGFRQIGKVIPLIQQFSTAQQALGVAQRGAGSLAKDAATAQEGLAVKITKVREEFIGLIRDIGQSKGFQTFVDISLKLASALISIADAAKGVLPALTAIVAIRGISNIGNFVSGFSQSVAGGGGARRRRFASGGFVPGFGNGDTVPAMLTPGEFVIRKKAVQAIGTKKLAALNRSSGGYIPTQNFQNGGNVQKFAQKGTPASAGRVKKAPLIDDIANATGTTLPRPRIALSDIISAGGGAVDVDRTLKRTVGDQAYARAKTPEEQQAVIKKYFLDPKNRLDDIKSSRLTQFGKELQVAIQSGKVNPSTLSIVSKSTRVPGVAEYLHKLFGIPVANMAFTAGGGKQDFMDALRTKGSRAQRVRRFMFGGEVQKFAQKTVKPDSGRVKDVPGYRDPLQVKEAMRKSGGSVRLFGLASISAKVGRGSGYKRTLVAKPKNMDPVPVGIMVGSIDKKNATLAAGIDKQIKHRFGLAIDSTAKQLATMFNPDAQVKPNSSKAFREQVINNSGFQQVIGSVFEGALNMIGSPFFEKSEATKSMDFPFGLGAAASLFNIPGNIPTDATRTAGSAGKGPGAMIKQIERYLEAENQGLYSKELQVIKSKGVTSSTSDEIRRLSQNPEDKRAISDVLSRNRGPAIPGGIKAQRVADNYFTNTLPKALERNPRALSELEALIRFKKGFAPMGSPRSLMLRKATGGGISGQDTVPALLTPGEFVINKKAASRLGSSKLNKLNRADKIQGFNSGGSVGNIQSFAGGGGVQRFFVGGLVRGMEGLVRVVTNLSTRMSTLGRNIPSGGGWTGGTRLGSMGVPDRSGDRMRNFAGDPMTLLFGAGIAGDFISKAGSPAMGAAVAGGAGAAGIMATLAPLIGLTGPLGILATLLTGVTAGFFEYQSAQRQATIELNQSKSQSEAAILEQQFTILASKIKVTSESFDGIKTSLSNLQAYANTIRTTTIEEATPGTLARFAGINLEFFTAGFAGKNLGRMSPSQQASVSKQLESTARPVGEQTQRAVTEAMRRSRVGYDTAVNMVGGSRRDIAIAQGGSRVTDLEATLESVKVDRSLSPEVKKIRIEALETRIANTINYLNEEFKTLTESQIQNAKATNIASQVINQFGEGMKNLGSATSRASAEFDRSLTDIDIQIGTKLGGQVKAVSPSINENVFENLRAYSSGQVESTIRDMGGRLGFSQEFTQQAISSVQIQQSLEKGLSPIFARLAAKQASGTDEDTITTDLRKELTKLFKPLNLDPTNLGTILDQLTEQFATLAGQGADVTLSKLAESSVALQKVLGAHTQTTDGLNNTAKALNSRQQELSSKLLEYSNALSRATEYQIEAASIRTQGRTQLKQALNKPVTLDELNKPFEDSVRTLTSGTSVRTGQRMAGTLDPAVIAARLQQTEDERNRLQQKQNTGQQLTQDEQLRLAQVNAQAANLEKALKSLSDNSSRASNALAKIQDLQKARQGRQDTFLDLLSNINNPEYLMDFVLNQQRYSAVMSGQNVGIQDLPGAVQALNTAMRGMSSEDQTRTLDRFIQQASASLGLDPQTLRQLTLSLGGPEAEMNDAISRYNEAIEAQARANEEFAKRATDAGKTLYDWIVDAGKEFARTVGGGAVVPKPEVVNAGTKATGGLIYASRGKYVNYEPRGTDTVPAMLTPGEFVINAKATKKNLSLLKAINSGNKGYSKGGLVYLQGGGFVSSVDEEIKQLQERIVVFDDETQNIIRQLFASTPETNPDISEQLQEERYLVDFHRIKSIKEVRNTEKLPLTEQLQRLVSTQQYEQNQNLVKEKFDAAKAAEEAENNIPLVLDQDSREAQKQAYIQQQEQKFATDQTRAKAQITQYEKYKEAFLDPNYRGPDAVRIAEQRKRAQESGFMAGPELTPKEKVEKIKEQKRQEFLNRNPRLAQKEKEEKEQATRWWNSGGRFEDPNAPTDQFVPDDVVKRYNRLTAQQRATQIAEQQAADIAYQKSGWPEETAFRNKETADNQRAQSGRNLYWSTLMLPDGTSYSDAKSEDIYRDLSKSSMPSGYRSLNSEQQKSADLAIEHWMREYEAKRSEGARESQKASKKAERESQKLERKAEIDLARRAVQAGVVGEEDIGVERVPIEWLPGASLPSYSSTRPLTSEEKDKLAQEETKNRDRAVEDRRVLEKEALDRQAQDISRRKTEMIRRSDKDLGSRTRTNPYTGKPFENAGQEAGVTKRAAFENKSFTQIEAEREAGRTAVQTAVARRTKEEEERLAREAYAKEQTEYEERMRVASKKATEQRRYEQIRFERREKNKGYLGYLAPALYDDPFARGVGETAYGFAEVGIGATVGLLGLASTTALTAAGLISYAADFRGDLSQGPIVNGEYALKPRQELEDNAIAMGAFNTARETLQGSIAGFSTMLTGFERMGTGLTFDVDTMEQTPDSALASYESQKLQEMSSKPLLQVPIPANPLQPFGFGGDEKSGYSFRLPSPREILQGSYSTRDTAFDLATPTPAIPGLSAVGKRVAGGVGRVAGALDQTIAQPVGRALQQKGIQQRVTDVVSTGTKRVSNVGQNLGARFRAVNDAMTIENAARIKDVRSGTTRVVNPTTGRVERIPDIFADNPEEYFKLFPEAEQRVFGKKFEYNNQLIREKTDAVIQRARGAEAANILEEIDVSVAPRPTSEILPSATSQPLPNQIILTPEQKAAEAARLAQERLNTQKPLLQSLNEPTSIVYQNAPINSAAATEAAQRAAIKQSGRSSGSTTIPQNPPASLPSTGRTGLVEPIQPIDPQAALRAQMEGSSSRAVSQTEQRGAIGSSSRIGPDTPGPVFQFEAIDVRTGKEIRDTVEAANEAEAQATIRSMGYIVTNLKARKARMGVYERFERFFKETFQKQSQLPTAKSRGGIVYASKGKLIPYQPRGTDTVPAMLTPGEFVVNRKSAKENMGLLRAINTGKNVNPQRLNRGGLVNTQYYDVGGQPGSPSSSAGGVSSISLDTSSLDTAFGNFQTTVGNFATEIGKFDSSISKLNDIASALGSLGSIDLTTPAADLKNSSVSVKDAVGLLQSQIGPFSSSVTTLASAISRIPQTITLTAQGSIPVNGTITVILDGSATGDLDSTNSEKVQKSVFDKIALAINQATAGSLNIVQS